jgi:monoamine oxidase
MKPEARVAAALEDAERVHPGLKAALTTGESVAWDAEPFARGAYAWFKPGELTELGPAAKAPEARVHFAGDGTSYRPGFMHGALSSVKRVVAEVLEAGR